MMNFYLIISLLNSASLGTIDLSAIKCGAKQEQVMPLECKKDGEEVSHCDSKKFCFNGQHIIDEKKGANKLMLEFLCTDSQYPKYADELTFGPCNKGDKELVHDQKMVCNCQENAWVCQPFKNN